MQFGTLNTKPTQEKMVRIIEASFETRPMPGGNVTQSAVSERVEYARAIYLVLRNECGWSDERIFDHLPAFLARKLDGEDAIPEWARKKAVVDGPSAMWGSEAAGRVQPERRLTALGAVGDEPLIIVPGRS